MATANDIELFSARVCPYAHRTRLVLAEKGLDFELTEIDFENKPRRFLEISRYGKVPALVHAGNEIYESAIINEYLEEAFPEPALMPADPGSAATRNRIERPRTKATHRAAGVPPLAALTPSRQPLYLADRSTPVSKNQRDASRGFSLVAPSSDDGRRHPASSGTRFSEVWITTARPSLQS